ncbi:hypothetical protein BO70DRAFT_392601 [Aspergillus heteromorphus CBS 117.55]|uniref:Uncharacterized protein n=1 Tax=Aspergillus heteromorphus CBS 117.55 TaxID=1448321 RepID=A0A317X031_9EURO|nr:uncharacterized protein BO70DRAFT_392601 [Aspergillus heteromorphus CBS 117.55]PWY90932.1 hypothetical protein BO70DRAFT_392601 [Aspergillus heteromorphus CBS 117.55]
MNLLASLTAFLSLLSLITAAPADHVDEATHSAVSALQKRDPVMCTPTGDGYCNLGIATYSPSGTFRLREVYIYDRYCKEIGTRPLNNETGHVSVYSLLPWTVEVNVTEAGIIPGGYFWYAGRKTDLGKNMYCRNCSGLTDWECCQAAFDCH